MEEDIEIWQSGFVKGFALLPYDKALYGNVMGLYEGKQVEFLIRHKRKKITSNTHAYYRGVLLPYLINHTEEFRGWKTVDIHKYFVSKHLKDVVEKQMGEVTVLIVTTLSTGEISQKRMNDFINDVRQDLSEIGVDSPDPVRI